MVESQPPVNIPSRTSSRSRWLALFVLTSINYLNYIDRNIFSALLPAIKDELHFSDTELGVLGSAFLYAYMFSAPLFGYLGDHRGRSRVMAAGVSIWSVATAFSGAFSGFAGQFLTRAAVGFGESAYTVIAPSTIADHFSKQARGKVFAVYSGAITIGSALGFVLGGWLNARFGWHRAFFVVGVPGLIFALLLVFIPDPVRGGTEEQTSESSDHPVPEVPLVARYVALFKNGGFLYTVLGYAAYTFVVGGMAFWMPSYLVRYFHVSLEKADVQFGAMTVAGGFVGTLIGGVWSDRIERRTGNGPLKVSIYSMVWATPLFIVSLCLSEYVPFMASLFLLEVALFMCLSPLDAAVIGYVQPGWRATAMALNVFLIHVLGDGISRPFLGFLSDKSNLHVALCYLPIVLVVAGALWVIGLIFNWQPTLWPEGAVTLPRWQAHRGYRPENSGLIENTLPAFRSARAAGAVMAECDVRLTADLKAVVFHDDDLQRLAGRSDLVAHLSAEDMAKYVQAPLLSEMLRDANGPACFNIELKSKDGPFAKGKLEQLVVQAVFETGSESRVMFSSFNPFALRRLSQLAPNVPRALIATDHAEPGNSFYLRKMLLGFWARAQIVHFDARMLDRKRIDRWHERGLRVVAWTVNDPVRARELLAMGVAGVISDEIMTDSQITAL